MKSKPRLSSIIILNLQSRKPRTVAFRLLSFCDPICSGFSTQPTATVFKALVREGGFCETLGPCS